MEHWALNVGIYPTVKYKASKVRENNLLLNPFLFNFLRFEFKLLTIVSDAQEYMYD
jgi:hypothetical protein